WRAGPPMRNGTRDPSLAYFQIWPFPSSAKTSSSVSGVVHSTPVSVTVAVWGALVSVISAVPVFRRSAFTEDAPGTWRTKTDSSADDHVAPVSSYVEPSLNMLRA